MFIMGEAMDIGVAMSDAELPFCHGWLRCILGYACALASVL